MRDARLRAKDYQHRWHGKWAEERARPISQRRFFSFGEIAERLARDPRGLAADPAIRVQVGQELVEWVQTQQFHAGDVVTLSGDPPDFRDLELPLPLADRGVVLLPDEAVALRRDACRRYAEARADLPGAASLLHDWFAAADTPQSEPASTQSSSPPLRGRTLDDALDSWALKLWGADLTKLPNRDELLRRARTRPGFSHVNQQDIRDLRRRRAPDQIKRGGGGMHRRS
jgi:hypothetical protein